MKGKFSIFVEEAPASMRTKNEKIKIEIFTYQKKYHFAEL